MEEPWEALAYSSALAGEPAPALIPVRLPTPPDRTLTTRHDDHLAPLLHSVPLRAREDVSWWHGLLPGAKISLQTQLEHLVLGRSSLCHSGEFHRDPLVMELGPPFSHFYQCHSELRISLALVNTIFLFF